MRLLHARDADGGDRAFAPEPESEFGTDQNRSRWKSLPLHGLHGHIDCDQAWSARSVTIKQTLGDAQRRLGLERAGDGWLVDGARDARLDGCAEPDLGLTPSTNALAIRRLGLAIGQAAEIRCAWVKFPALSVEPSLQRYERLGERDYRYTNVASGFSALVAVDALALPVAYEGVWTRIADWQGDGS